MKQQDEMWVEVLKWMGWHVVERATKGSPFGVTPDGETVSHLPSLTLDALHEAEAKLQDQCKYWPDYIDELSKEFRFDFPGWDSEKKVNWSQMVHASKEQRLLALWRTVSVSSSKTP